MSSRGHFARDVTVGLVVVGAALIFAAAVFSIGSEQRLWSKKIGYRIRLPNTNGLQIGSPVRLVGVQVGTVSDIRFSDDPNRVDIDIVFKVDEAVRSRIRADTTASLKVLSLLGGDKFIDLTPGTPAEPALPPDSYVAVPEAMGFEELQALGATIADDLQQITSSLKVVLAQLQNRETFLGQALFDPNFGKETFANLKETVISANKILHKVEEGDGLAGRLLTDRKFAEETMRSLKTSMDHVETLLSRLTDDEGTLHQAFLPDGPVATSLKNVEKSTATLLAITQDLDKGEGIAGRLLKDDEYAARVLDDLEVSVKSLREILDKINRGEGTAGAFVNDPQIYQDLQDVLRGIKNSKLMSGVVHHYRKKGEKLRLEEEEEQKKSEPDPNVPSKSGEEGR